MELKNATDVLLGLFVVLVSLLFPSWLLMLGLGNFGVNISFVGVYPFFLLALVLKWIDLYIINGGNS